MSEHRQMSIVEDPAIVVLDLDLSLDRFQDGLGEVDAGERGAAFEVARRKDVHLEDLVTHDVDPDEEHAVGDELGPNDLGDAKLRLADFYCLSFPARVNVGAYVVLGGHTPERGIFATDLE